MIKPSETIAVYKAAVLFKTDAPSYRLDLQTQIMAIKVKFGCDYWQNEVVGGLAVIFSGRHEAAVEASARMMADWLNQDDRFAPIG